MRNVSRVVSFMRVVKIRVFITVIASIVAVVVVVLMDASRTEPAPTGGSSVVSFHEPQAFDSVARYATVGRECPGADEKCFDRVLQEITIQYGPEAALKVATMLQVEGKIRALNDDHQIAHRIGRATAEAFGINGKAFLLCPTTYNYGCQHGFFEYALGRAGSTEAAVRTICGEFENDSSYSSKFSFYCYHGAGHGVLMAQAYDLTAALVLCDTLPTSIGQQGCWQGVFMENVNAAMRGEARSGIFSDTNPLAPCSVIAEKYHHECFINHAGWLMSIFHNSVSQASAACLDAPTGSVRACMQSIGLMVSNPTWQFALAPELKGESNESVTWKLCEQFPTAYIGECVWGAVDNIMNFDEFDPTRAGAFCNLVRSSYEEACYKRIGVSLRSQSINVDDADEYCHALGEPGRIWCRIGVGS